MLDKKELAEASGVSEHRVLELEQKARSLADEFISGFDSGLVRLVQKEMGGLTQEEIALLLVLFGARVGAGTAFALARALLNVANEIDRGYSLVEALLKEASDA